jgi:prefoldin subunit 5
VLTNQNDIQIVANWNALLKSHDYTALTAALNTPGAVLQKLKQIKAEEIQKVFTPTNPNGFTIEVFVTDISILPDIQKGIVYGFDNADYVKDRLLSKKARLEELIDKTSEEIKRIDSTKKIIENIITGKGSSSSSLVVDPSTISRQLIEMNEKLLNFKEELKFTNAVQVLQGFSQFKKPAGPNLFVWLSLGLITGLTIAYLIALFRSINQKLKARAQQ